MKRTYSDEQIIDCDPFDGERDVDIKCRTTRVITVRKPQVCWMGVLERKPHTIEPGQRARFEKALVDGEWGQWYACVPCITATLKQYGERPTSPCRGTQS